MLKIGEELGSVVGVRDRYGDRLWLRLGTESYHCNSIKACSLLGRPHSFGVVAVLNRGDTYLVNLDNIEHVVRMDGSIWEPARRQPLDHAGQILQKGKSVEDQRWDHQAKIAADIIVGAALIGLMALAIFAFTGWRF